MVPPYGQSNGVVAVDKMSVLRHNQPIVWGMPESAHSRYLGLILACFILLAGSYGLVVPPFVNLDELEHFEVVRYIAEIGRLPVHGTPAAEEYRYRQEASQPPLYHLLSAGVVRLLGLRADDSTTYWRLNPRVACGPGAPALYDNRAVLYHNHNEEAFPWHGTLLTLHLLRVWSTLLQAGTVVGTYALARLAFPQRREVGLVATSVVAFNPQFLLVASGVNNDNLVVPLATLGLCLVLRTWRDGLSLGRALGLGLLVGLAGLSKLSGWLLLVLAGLVLLAIVVRAREARGRLILRVGLIPVVASLIAGWWFWRNWQLYHDPTALRPMLALVGTQTSPFHPLSAASLLFRSFWGQIPCSFYPTGFYVFYALLTVLAVSGLAWAWRRLAPAARVSAAILFGWLLIVVVGWMRWDAITPAPGGRLLFPALPAVGCLMALGIGALAQGRLSAANWVVVGLLALFAVGTAAYVLPAFFAPPPRFADASEILPEHPLDAEVGETIRLLGYDTTRNDQEPVLDVTLYWQPTAAMTEDYVLTLQLVSPVVGDTTLRWNYNSWPGRGNYPTSAWQPGELIVDRYRFQLPKADFYTQAWELHLALYGEEGRLPIRLADVPVGDYLVLTRLRMPGRAPVCPEEGRLSSEVQFADAVALTHALVVEGQEEATVVLCWSDLKPLSRDYHVFVHLYDESGALVNTADGPPMGGAFPTSFWRPGDVVRDVHTLAPAMDEEEVGRRIGVGFYDLADGSRLPAHVGNVPAPDGTVVVWPDRP